MIIIIIIIMIIIIIKGFFITLFGTQTLCLVVKTFSRMSDDIMIELWYISVFLYIILKTKYECIYIY
jgi:hypothetical protein